MQALKERIRREGENLGRGILKIDSFLNHQIDAALMEAAGEAIAAQFAATRPTRILTAEVSGIIPATMAGRALGNLPVVYARKHKPITMREPVYVDAAPSHTKGGEVMLMVSPEFLSADDRILIVDDFLATGRTIDALARIVRSAGAELVGIAAIVEKDFEGGRAELAHWGVPIVALATIVDMSEGRIVLSDG
ncbi:MAG: xanthine phosphoribosyltransferase [Anaerolineae bacterium]|uniref:xanthine phosphoribosyltransferase n=1 Tax=Promineifilum sp. TaxID=2664178 RepID=UPI001D391ED2|nr:xanthine phosphoribosyltransferase [Anaerolineales bacterium]MCO5179290.1 xanthine phosphoribosyltransferase [Promineifilum sp.]MCW5847675.1 xanthine phosphoribosyltransferase [Anaerolineae bacterium]